MLSLVILILHKTLINLGLAGIKDSMNLITKLLKDILIHKEIY